MSRSRRLELGALAAALLCFVLIALTIELPAEEDAFIYYRYAWSSAHGLGLVFNPGDPVEGFSGPLWMGILALVARLGLDLPRTAPVLGLLCGVATLVGTWLLAWTAGLGRSGRLAAVALLALSYPFIVWARSGLETPLYALLAVIAVAAYLAVEYPPGDETRRRRGGVSWVACLVPALVCLGRPEGLLLVALILGDRLSDRRDFRGAIRYAVPAAVVYGGYLIWRFVTFHSLVPNTSVKLYPLLIGRSTEQFLGYSLSLGALPLALPVVALLASRRWPRPERRRLGFLFSAVCLLSFFFHFAAGGDYRPGFRFLVPTLPLLLVAIWLAAAGLARWNRGAPRLLGSPPARLALLLLLLTGALVQLHRGTLTVRGWRQRVFQSWHDPFSETDHWGVQIAHWVDRHVPPHGVVAFGQMGRVPYYLARQGHAVVFIDTLGLVDRPISRIYRFDGKLAEMFRQVRAGKSLAQALEAGRRERAQRVARSILERKPDFILIETALEDYQMMKALAADPEFQTAYRETDALPHGGPPYVRIYARTGRGPSASAADFF